MKNLKKILSIYKGKKIIVTGHTGFKGSWLSLLLKILGANVIGVSISPIYKNSHYHFLKNIFFKEYFFDLTDNKKTYDLIKENNPYFIFNLAAQSLVIKSYNDPYKTFYDNFVITLNILESIRLINKKIRVVFITSDKSYKNINSKKSYREEDSLGGSDPYSGSKGAIELLINSYSKSYFNNSANIRIAVGRAGNVIGGGDWSENRIIPDAFKAWYLDQQINLRSPFATRPWQHVLEPLFGYITLGYYLNLNKKNNGQCYNFGPKTKHKSVLNLISNLNIFWDKNRKLYKYQNKKNVFFKEANLLSLNSSKAKKNLNWECVLNYNETLKLIYMWYYEFRFNNSNIFSISIKQIEFYLNKLKNEK